MESPSSIHTREEQQRLLTPHEYTGEAFSLRYQDCVSCGHRTEFTCVKCGYCYSCHWKREQGEAVELRDNLKDFYASLSKTSNKDNEKQKLEQDVTAKSLAGSNLGNLAYLIKSIAVYIFQTAILLLFAIISFTFLTKSSSETGFATKYLS
jgi:hypothetical protein